MISILSDWISFLTYPNIVEIKGFVVVVVVVVVVECCGIELSPKI
jgi:hypothetical protein